MVTNFIPETSTDSAASTKLFFDTYGVSPLEFNGAEFDLTISFFKSRGFDNDAAIVTASTLLKQAKADNSSIQKLLDTLQGFNDIQITALIAEILNNNRSPISILGFRKNNIKTDLVSRNVAT
jgi:hypothetical protein